MQWLFTTGESAWGRWGGGVDWENFRGCIGGGARGEGVDIFRP